MQKQKDVKRLGKGELETIILKSIALAGVVGVALVAPGALVAMSQLGFVPGKRQRESVNASRDRLIEKGLLVYKDGFVRLTKKGQQTLRRLEIKNFALQRPRTWDRKWRLLIFDVPEYRRGTRDKIRRTLSMIGFVHLQHSVLLYPFDCEELVNLLKADFKIGRDVLYVVVERLEYDNVYKHHFRLPIR